MRRAALSLFCLPALSLLPAAAMATSPATRTAPVGTDRFFSVTARQLLKSAPAAAAYPNAGAVTLRDESVVHLHADGTYTETVYETFKIFNQRGRQHADVTVPYNEATQDVDAIHARTIRPDGRVLVVKPEDIHVSSPYSDFTLYDDAKTVGFSLPGVEDGAIVDYAYTVTARRALLPRQYAEHWAFQGAQDPVRLSRLTVTAPAALPLRAQAYNAPSLRPVMRVSADGRTKTYVWEMRDLAEITPEPMMPPGSTILPWMEVSTIPDWQTISGWYRGLAAPRMTAGPEVKKLVAQLTAGQKTDTDKARALFYWVEGKTRYVALELGLSAFQPHAASAVCENRYGDCKDMATLLVTMLHEAGIKTAWPVLLQAGNKLPTRDHLPSEGAFNHCIVRADIDGKPYWFDSTAEMCRFGDIPDADRGVDALVVRDGGGAFEVIPTGTPDDNTVTTTTKVRLSADGSAECETTLSTDGDASLGMRAAFRAIKPDLVKEGLRSVVAQISPNAALKDYTLASTEDRDTPMGFHCTFHAPLWASKTGPLLILNGRDSDEKDFALPERKFPVYQATCSKIVSDTVLTLPPGYTVESRPDDLHQQTPLGRYDLTCTQAGDTLTLHMVATNVPAEVAPTDYPKLKAQFEALVALMKQPIILRQASAPAKG